MTLRNTKLIGFATIIILLAVSYFLILSPIINSRKEISEQITQSNQELEALKSKNLQYEQSRLDYDSTILLDQVLGQAMPTGSESGNISNQIIDAGSRVGIPPENITISIEAASIDEKKNQLLAEASLSIGAKGDISQLASFVKEINNIPRAILATNVTLDKSEEISIVTISGKTFVYAPINVPVPPGTQIEQPEQSEQPENSDPNIAEILPEDSSLIEPSN